MKIDSYALARMLGISQATVSRAFTRPEKVSEATRKKIMDAAETLGYAPDKNASALRRKGSSTIMLLYIKREDGHYWTNVKRNYWIFSEAVLSLTRIFEKLPYNFEIRQIESVFSVVPSQIKDHCDGLMVFDFVTEEEAWAISKWKIPYVLCHRTTHLNSYNHSATDNLDGGQLQAHYLLDRGAARPLYIMNEEDAFSHNLRKKGFIEIFPKARIINTDDKQEMATQFIKTIREGEIDSLAFVNDMLLVQMLTKLSAAGLTLNDRYPLVGYDNSTVLLVLDHKPASIEIGIADIYRKAAEALIELIRGERNFISLVHEPTLIPPGD
jgi:LacI family transcriptional regulator